MIFDHNFVTNKLFREIDATPFIAETKFGPNSERFKNFSARLDAALSEGIPYYTKLNDAEEMHPINLYALNKVIDTAKNNLRLLTTNIPEQTYHGMDFFGDESIVSSLISAAKAGVKIDIILRQPEKFTFRHKLYSLASSGAVTFYDAIDEELRDCKCRYAIADDTISKFRYEVGTGIRLHDEVEIVANSTSDEISELIENFEFLISDDRFTKVRNFAS